jgi:alcohol dehydrogenase
VQVGLMVADYKDALVPMNQVIAKELEILGSHGMQAYEYGPMLEMITSGRLQPGKLISKTVSLEESLVELESMGESPPTGVVVIDRF